jgi:hypothetical protein
MGFLRPGETINKLTNGNPLKKARSFLQLKHVHIVNARQVITDLNRLKVNNIRGVYPLRVDMEINLKSK